MGAMAVHVSGLGALGVIINNALTAVLPVAKQIFEVRVSGCIMIYDDILTFMYYRPISKTSQT